MPVSGPATGQRTHKLHQENSMRLHRRSRPQTHPPGIKEHEGLPKPDDKSDGKVKAAAGEAKFSAAKARGL